MLPSDFDRALWLNPLAFQELVGRALAVGEYESLFRADGFAKPIADLRKVRKLARFLPLGPEGER